MKNQCRVLLTLTLGMAPMMAVAADGAALAKSNGCLACHNVAVKMVGPSYKAVAKKYKGDSKAPARLFEKVRKGGKGVWGPTPMPPQTTVSDADLKVIIAWVLAQ
jgi:cytochrome c